MSVTVSRAFRRTAIRAVFSIILFVFTYLLLFILAVGLFLLCAYFGISMMILKPSLMTFILGVGLLCMGFLVIYFLLKFMFKKHKTDRSDLTEITREQEPALFAMITEIVEAVKTDFPKKVYLSSDVNAAVFYDSSFWSMFLPVKKNLQIGVGLVNTMTALELKSILAHEFGHFSQRSMKLNNYVYNANQVIYNLLFDNSDYTAMVKRLSNIGWYMFIFGKIALIIVQGIKYILKKNYEMLNLNNMSLSRQMEFHADEVAANVTGAAPLATSLLRIDLAAFAFNLVMDYYRQRVDKGIITNNIYTQQLWMMRSLAKDSRLVLENGLPQVPLELLVRYNKSRLVIKDQWASHPNKEDRIGALEKLGIRKENDNGKLANTILRDAVATQEMITAKLFANVQYQTPVTAESDAAFIAVHEQNAASNALPELFNGYYDQWNPSPETYTGAAIKPLKDLFGPEAIAIGFAMLALENDQYTLQQLDKGNHSIKTFDYDGVKYTMSDVKALLVKVDKELEDKQVLIQTNDAQIYRYFATLAEEQGQTETFNSRFGLYAQAYKDYNRNFEYYLNMRAAVAFMQERKPPLEIEGHIEAMKEVETAFREQLNAVLQGAVYQMVITAEIREILEKYVGYTSRYFNVDHYDDDALHTLFTTLDLYHFILSRSFFELKKSLLDFEAGLVHG